MSNLDDIFDNEVSYSPFGYSFQADAGIFLFLNFFNDLKSISIESNVQDIFIKDNSNGYIAAQAKSAQNPFEDKNILKKLKEALFSLIKNSSKNIKQYIYISNLIHPLDNDQDFDLRIDSYEYLNKDSKIVINDTLKKIKKGLEEKKDSPKSKLIIEKLNDFDLNKLYFVTIPKYYGDENKEQKIVETISSFLYDSFDIDSSTSIVISKKIYSIWHEMFYNDSTIKGNSIKKIMQRNDIIWPIVTITNKSYSLYDISEILDENIDQLIVNNISMLASSEFIKFQKFDVVNKILNQYYNTNKVKTSLDFELYFVQNNYKKYLYYFNYLNIDKKTTEYLTKFFIFCIIKNRLIIDKIIKGVK